jgi:hypothetical protein
MTRPFSYRFDVLLRLVQLTGETDAIERLHAAIQRQIAASSRRIDRAKASGDDEYLDAIVDDECDHIEELLGMAFVAAQTFITRFRTRLAWASNIVKDEFGAGLSFATPPKAYEVLARGRALPVGSGQSVIEVVNAVANYWKHQEDWPTREEAKGGRMITVWNVKSHSLRKQERRTIEVVSSIGMKPGSTGNLRTAAEVFGVTEYADLSPIRQELKVWADDLLEATRLEISQRRSGP